MPFATDGGHHGLAGDITTGVTGHSDYYAPDSESLWNMIAVVVDERDLVNVVPPSPLPNPNPAR